MKRPTLVIMAAGMGSRYGGLKQIEPVGPSEESLIDYSIHDAVKAGFGKVVFIIKKEIKDTFRSVIGKRAETVIETEYVFQRVQDIPAGFQLPKERVKPWGTAHAVLSCRNVLDAPFAVINADDYYGASSFQMICQYLSKISEKTKPYPFCMVGYQLKNTLTENGYVSRGICHIDHDGYLSSIKERTKIQWVNGSICYSENGDDWVTLPNESIVSMNLWGFTPDILTELDLRFSAFLDANRSNLLNAELYLPDVVGSLISDNRARVQVMPSSERWYGVTYQEDKPMVKSAIHEMVKQGIYPINLYEKST